MQKSSLKQSTSKCSRPSTKDSTSSSAKRDTSVRSSSSCVTSSSTCSCISMSSSVRFNSVEIREYNITIGDNPSCSSGCPISLGWHYDDDMISLPLDTYEEYRGDQRRALHEMKIPSTVRYDKLRAWDVPTKQIVLVQKECDEIKKQRHRTIIREQKRQRIKSFAKRLKGAVLQDCGRQSSIAA